MLSSAGRKFSLGVCRVPMTTRLLSMQPIPEHIEKVINPPQPEVSTARRSMNATIRTLKKTRQLERLRQGGLVPGVVHGIKDDGTPLKHLITVDTKNLLKDMREIGITLENTIYDLNVKDDVTGENVGTFTVTPRQLTTNPLTNLPTSVNFLRFQKGAKMRIPLQYINEDLCVDLKRGCFLLRINRFVEVVVNDEDSMPKYINVDLSSGKKGAVLTVADMTFPDNVRPSHRVSDKFVAAVIKNK